MSKGKVVLFATQKGGTGKSTIVLNVGHALNKRGVKVAIVDSDAQATAFSFYSQRRITMNESELEGFDMSFPEVAMISSGAPYRKQLGRIAEFFDVIIIDTKGEFEQFQHDLLRMSDYVISPIQASEFDLEPTKLVRDAVLHENTQRDPDEQLGLSYVMSKVNPSANSTKHISRLVGEMECHIMSHHIRSADVVSAISGLGFTILDAAENTSLINQVVNKRRHSSERASFDRDQVLDIANNVNLIADELMERLK